MKSLIENDEDFLRTPRLPRHYDNQFLQNVISNRCQQIYFKELLISEANLVQKNKSKNQVKLEVVSNSELLRAESIIMGFVQVFEENKEDELRK